MKKARQKLTLDQSATYEIRVPGHLDQSWSDWAGGMTITVESEGDGPPVTILTGMVIDQAALQGLLRRLYSLGLPLISVTCVQEQAPDDGALSTEPSNESALFSV